MGLLVDKFILDYFVKLNLSIKSIDNGMINKLILKLEETRESGKKIFFIGNGGSSAISNHMEVDFNFGTNIANNPFQAYSLGSNTSSVTATGNDLSFKDIYSRELTVKGNSGDLLIAISSSGNSQNILEACRVAKNKDIFIVGLCGFDGGKLKGISDLPIHVESDIGDYGIIEDLHSCILHLVAKFFQVSNK